jgi:hypothetical protein
MCDMMWFLPESNHCKGRGSNYLGGEGVGVPTCKAYQAGDLTQTAAVHH